MIIIGATIFLLTIFYFSRNIISKIFRFVKKIDFTQKLCYIISRSGGDPI
nr:MAG TPA: hypothetical protein [Caudoviricetes sp.]